MANMRHSLKNQIGPIRNDFETTKLFLDKLQESGDKFSWDLPIRPATREGDEVKSVSQVFKRIDRKFDELNDIMDKMKAIINLNKAKLNLEFVQVGKLIREVYDSLNLDPENTLIKCERSKIEAPLDVFWFREAISNLIINADRHGRIKEKELELYFEISKTENEKVRIYYANNGKPLPSEFDFETQFKGFKEKAGSEAGSGLGGYLINKVFESHEGSIHLIEGESNEPSLYNVEMEILIPRRI
jgi:light-regulated signal transduction histidine kinase (bacteriophytochrome)